MKALLTAVIGVSCLLGAHEAQAGKFFDIFNHPDLDWYVIETEHFRTFYPISKKGPEENRYYVDGTDSARRGAFVNEEMYTPTCKQYDFFLKETVNVILLEQSDSIQGYTIPNFDWIVVSTRHSDYLWRWRGHGDWLRMVLYHEYAHVVSLKADGVWAENSFGWYLSTRWRDGAYNLDTGASVFVGDGDPWWWVEGNAEYTSEEAGINTWNSNRDMWMRADILEGTLLNKADWEDYYGRNAGLDGERHYNSGYNFAVYLEEQYGEGIYQSFAKTKRENGWTANFDKVVEDTLNVTVEELRQGWIEWATAKYTKVRDDVMAEPAIGAQLNYVMPAWEKPIGDEDRDEWEEMRPVEQARGKDADGWMRMFPRYSPDGRYYSDYEVRGSKLTVREIDEETWMPIRGAYLDDEEDEELIAELGVAQIKSGREKGSAASVSGSGQFDWSPDGTRIVTQCSDHGIGDVAYKTKFFTYPRGYLWYSLCVTDVTENEDGELNLNLSHRIPGALRSQDPAWSPDGEWIAYITFADGNQFLNKIKVDDRTQTGDSRVQLTPWDDQTELEMVDWSPDGSQLVFGAYRNNMSDLWVMNADGTDLHPITHDRYEDRDPFWADDGMIYFSSDRVGGIYNIYRYNPNAEIGWKDTDGDGFADSEDKCPEEAETVNHWRDLDGCPDTLPVRVTAERVEITEKVLFELGTANLSPDSNTLLDLVAAIVVEHDELTSIEVASHTDIQGKKKENQTLSEDRAKAVADYLIGKGVPEGRLVSKGYGQVQPLVDEENDEAYAKNRRVEFVILERVEKAVAEPAEGAAGTPAAEEPAEEAAEETAEAAEAVTDGGGKQGCCGSAECDARLANAPEALLVVREHSAEICAAKATDEEMEMAALVQLTNVLYGAFTPSITPTGNLLYSYYTAWGWKPYGLNKDDFFNHVVDDTSLAINMDDVNMGVQEEYPAYTDNISKVPTGGKYIRPPMAIPMVIVENQSRSHIGVTGGVQIWGSDFLSNSDAFMVAVFGEDSYVAAGVTINKFAPVFNFGTYIRQIKYDYAFLYDIDEDVSTTDDAFLGEFKGAQYIYAGWGGVEIPINYNMQLGFNHFQYGINSSGSDSGTVQEPIFYHQMNTLSWSVASFSESSFYRSPHFAINPSGGVRISVDAGVNYSDSLYEYSNGVSADDGELFDRYAYPEFQFNAIGYIPVPWAKKWEHTLQLDFGLGIIPMNVDYNDEFRGGGQSALNFRNPWSTNTAFSGYEAWSLGGETMGVINAAYRLPIRRDIDKKFGVFYLESIFLQFFGTAGNFWSYRIDEDADVYDFYGDKVAYDSADIIREAPFSDRLDNCPDSRKDDEGQCGKALFPMAHMNGNRMLFDAGVELRISGNLFNRSSWNSFIRVAYGFNSVGGIGDVDGDDIYTNVSDPNLNAASSEKERASVRLYVGLGTGW